MIIFSATTAKLLFNFILNVTHWVDIVSQRISFEKLKRDAHLITMH